MVEEKQDLVLEPDGKLNVYSVEEGKERGLTVCSQVGETPGKQVSPSPVVRTSLHLQTSPRSRSVLSLLSWPLVPFVARVPRTRPGCCRRSSLRGWYDRCRRSTKEERVPRAVPPLRINTTPALSLIVEYGTSSNCVFTRGISPLFLWNGSRNSFWTKGPYFMCALGVETSYTGFTSGGIRRRS